MQKNIVQVILNILFILSISVLAYFHFSKKDKIAFIRTNYVLSKYQGMIDATNSYKEKSTVWQANIDTLSKEFQKSVDTYQRDRAKMSERERKVTEELLSTKQKQLIDYEGGIKQKAQQEDQTLTKAVYERVNQYLNKYGELHGYKIIFAANETGNIVFGNDALDISDLIINELNKEYKGKY